MKQIYIILLFFCFNSCGKPKTVLICGDHICINKSEAEQYFEKNLSIEVRIIDNAKKQNFNLVELNLNNNQYNKRNITIEKKVNTSEEIKVLTNDEIGKIKEEIKKNKKNKKIVKKVLNNEIKSQNVDNNILKDDTFETSEINIIKKRQNVVDVCTIIEKCSIDEISKYLLKEGMKKDFPDITTRE